MKMTTKHRDHGVGQRKSYDRYQPGIVNAIEWLMHEHENEI